MNAPEMFDQVDRCGEVSAGERLRLQRCQGIVGALYGEENCNCVYGIVGDRRGNHCGPEGEALALEVKDRRQNDEVEKIRHIPELHEIVESGAGKLREPQGGMNSGEVEIELDEIAVEPIWVNRVDEVLEFLEEENIQRQGIPVAREVDEFIVAALIL